MKKWFIHGKSADFKAVSEKFGISQITARLLRNRELIRDEDIDYYLNATLSDMHSPHLLSGLDSACDIILDFIRRGKHIRIIGDYDIDGVCSTVILVKGLRAVIQKLGADAQAGAPDNADDANSAGSDDGGSDGGHTATVSHRLPDRIKDGYGLNENIIREAHDEGVDLIITCDNGIAAAKEIRLAKELGMSVIVTDHHEIPFEEDGDIRTMIIPDADAVIDPHLEDDTYPFKMICGGMVAYKLILALAERVKGVDTDELLDFAAFATVGDIMPLLDENRVCVKYGLRSMGYTSNIGLSALIDATGVKRDRITAYHIGFILGPCVNAAGRLESAEIAMKLFLSEDIKEAEQLANRLKETNDTRKNLMESKIKEAVEIIESGSDGHDYNNDTVLVIYLDECHESLAGLVAGRLREHFTKPSIVFTDAVDGIKGSGRSIEQYNMFEELSKCKHLFTKFGGHKMAAGLTIPRENFEELRTRLNENSNLTEADLVEKYMIDIDMPVNYVSMELIRELEMLEPFGQDNPAPLFAQKNLKIMSRKANAKGNFVTLALKSGPHGVKPETTIYATMFTEASEFLKSIAGHDTITVAYVPEYNDYFDRVQIKIKDYLV